MGMLSGNLPEWTWSMVEDATTTGLRVQPPAGAPVELVPARKKRSSGFSQTHGGGAAEGVQMWLQMRADRGRGGGPDVASNARGEGPRRGARCGFKCVRSTETSSPLQALNKQGWPIRIHSIIHRITRKIHIIRRIIAHASARVHFVTATHPGCPRELSGSGPCPCTAGPPRTAESSPAAASFDWIPLQGYTLSPRLIGSRSRDARETRMGGGRSPPHAESGAPRGSDSALASAAGAACLWPRRRSGCILAQAAPPDLRRPPQTP
eukprot:1184755-Prorocentrum_minimum.AAC.3